MTPLELKFSKLQVKYILEYLLCSIPFSNFGGLVVADSKNLSTHVELSKNNLLSSAQNRKQAIQFLCKILFPYEYLSNVFYI